MNVLPLILLGLLGAEEVVDSFQFTNVQQARQAWVAKDGTPPVELPPSPAYNGGGLKVPAPFASDSHLPRTVIDRRVKLDLAAAGAFTLEVASDVPEGIAYLTFYFRSGNGWYAATGSVGGTGWQTLRFDKDSFGTEGRPTGWHQIDTIRISAWRGAPKDTSLSVRRLMAIRHDVALVVAGGSDKKLSLDTAQHIRRMLQAVGLPADVVDQRATAQGALRGRRAAVLVHNPRLDGETLTALERFVNDGGKLLVCYVMPPRLGKLLGFGNAKYHKQQRDGQFAEIRFDATDIPGLPERVKQASWNITTAEPAGHNARIIGRWYDDQGKPTGKAAMLISDRGAFLSHIVLPDDRTGKRQLLAAVLGKLAPPLWPTMAQSTLDRALKVGHCDGLPAILKYSLSDDLQAVMCLADGFAAWKNAEMHIAQGSFPEAIELAGKSRELLIEGYLRAQPSPNKEGRAIWNHSGTGAFPGDWQRSAKLLADNGFNMVLPNLLWAGRAHYPSDVLPRSETFKKYGDQVEQCLAAAKKHGLEVHVWKVNYNLLGAPKEFVEKLGRQGRLMVAADGKSHNWLCPSHPDNKKLELDSMLEVARKYPVDGLHFDYIRYPGRQFCFCDGCRERFEADSGRKVGDWPKQCHTGDRADEYTDWRCDQITWLVEAVHREGKKLRPELKISAAVFGAYPDCRRGVLQDWPVWIRRGYLDFVCPMDYTQNDQYFKGLVENQLRLVEGRIPLYPGIGAWRLTHDRTVGQIHHARALGAQGFTIFNFDQNAAETTIPSVGLGAGRESAVPPHHRRAGGG